MSTRHQWSAACRTAYRTTRECHRCGLVKVTRHEPGERAWQEFERDGMVLRGMAGTPKCALPARESAS